MIEPMYRIFAEVEAEMNQLSYVVDGDNELQAITDAIHDIVDPYSHRLPRSDFLELAALAVAALEVIDKNKRAVGE
jgi:hypothetical protein